MDYSIFYKSELDANTNWTQYGSWDLFLSAYNSSERVKVAHSKVVASKKHWLLFPEYEYKPFEFPSDRCFQLTGEDESEVMDSYFRNNSEFDSASKICIDSTGFIRPYLVFLMLILQKRGIKNFDVLYSEPFQYLDKETTRFSDENIISIRQIHGFEGNHVQSSNKELLIICSGYDDKLISQVSYKRNNAKKIQMFGLPSLRPEMYQENILRAEHASEAVGRDAGENYSSYFSPAYDPFITANVLRDIVQREKKIHGIENVYLSPLATKPQVIGFALYYLYENVGLPTSMIFPFCKSYARETSKGISRIWKYTIELP